MPARPTHRAPQRSRPNKWRPAAAVALVLSLTLLVAACGGAAPDAATGTPATTDAAPTSTTEGPIVPATTDPPGTTRFNVYWLRDCPSADTATEVGGCRIAVGTSRTTTDTDILTAALVALGEGPDATEQMAGLTSNIRPIVDLRGVTVEDGIAVVDYNRYFESATTRPQVAQVVYTLTQFPTITGVRFLVDGAPNGATGTRPTARVDVLELAPPVLVESPAPGSTVGPAFAVAGTLAADDVTFTVGVVQTDGSPLPDGAGAAAFGAAITPAPSAPPPFTQRVTLPSASDGPVVVVVTAADGTESRIPVIVQSP